MTLRHIRSRSGAADICGNDTFTDDKGCFGVIHAVSRGRRDFAYVPLRKVAPAADSHARQDQIELTAHCPVPTGGLLRTIQRVKTVYRTLLTPFPRSVVEEKNHGPTAGFVTSPRLQMDLADKRP